MVAARSRRAFSSSDTVPSHSTLRTPSDRNDSVSGPCTDDPQHRVAVDVGERVEQHREALATARAVRRRSSAGSWRGHGCRVGVTFEVDAVEQDLDSVRRTLLHVALGLDRDRGAHGQAVDHPLRAARGARSYHLLLPAPYAAWNVPTTGRSVPTSAAWFGPGVSGSWRCTHVGLEDPQRLERAAGHRLGGRDRRDRPVARESRSVGPDVRDPRLGRRTVARRDDARRRRRAAAARAAGPAPGPARHRTPRASTGRRSRPGATRSRPASPALVARIRSSPCGPVPLAVARPVRLHQEPLLGRGPDQHPRSGRASEAVTRSTSRTEPARAPAWIGAGRIRAEVPPAREKYVPTGSSVAPVRKASTAGPAGHRRRARRRSRQPRRRREIRGRTRGRRPGSRASARSTAPPASVAEGDHLHPEALPASPRTTRTAPAARPARSRRVAGTRRVASHRAGEVPVPEVREGDDGAATRRDPGVDVLEALAVEVVLDPRGRSGHAAGRARTSSARSCRTLVGRPDRARGRAASRRWRGRDCGRPARASPATRRRMARAAERAQGRRARAGAPREISAGPVREISRAIADVGHAASGSETGRASRASPEGTGGGADSAFDAWRQTITKRCTAVRAVSASITHRTGTSTSKTSPMPSRTMRSARSMSPPRAEKPSDSALARS